jgi:hypothetical protein
MINGRDRHLAFPIAPHRREDDPPAGKIPFFEIQAGYIQSTWGNLGVWPEWNGFHERCLMDKSIRSVGNFTWINTPWEAAVQMENPTLHSITAVNSYPFTVEKQSNSG